MKLAVYRKQSFSEAFMLQLRYLYTITCNRSYSLYGASFGDWFTGS